MDGLASIGNRDLEANLKSLVRKERMLLHLILEYIREVDARRLYLEHAYSSMYDYLTKELGYSSSAALRRLEAARLMNVVPGLADKIQQGSINLTQVGELTRAIHEKEKTGERISNEVKSEIIDQIAGLSGEQTQKTVAMSLDIELKDPERVRIQKDESVHLSITLTREQFEILTSCKEKAAHSLQLANGDHSWAKVIEVVAGQYLDEKSSGREEKSFSRSTDSRIHSKNKTLTLKTRRFILNRDKCCQYKDKRTGRICGSKYGLQVDHIIPRWSGGTHEPENLQVLCWSHNNQKYREEAGIKFRSSS
ncbi:HNH endonuclease [Bdellovibrio sp. SKB1291214]|uniref:HNH endonuclease n=1 Tax=Bdellovibrio sp. SKB1291214 TaxID=1732569 RepID=UPI000B51863E|nr:HNH endonuclease signature motif containing protein [Bdellovibrio sp. SKB1291214]UYL07968.1 HNH endonuclease [Bdellovibrio sp. SKB1291214]